MDNNEGEVVGLSDDDSIYKYLRLNGKDCEGEEKDQDDSLENYLLDDYKLDSSQIEEQPKNETELNLNSQKNPTESELFVVEQRLHLISCLKKLHEEQHRLKLKNSYLHKKCCDVIIKSKTMNYLERWGFDSHIHKDKRYIEVLKEFKKIKERKEEAENKYKDELAASEDAYQLRLSEFQETFKKFKARELEIGIESISRGTDEITMASIKDLLHKQEERLNVLSRVRVKFLKLKNTLENINSKLEDKNILDEGYTIIKYENLVMNKSILLEKIDERERDLENIRDKFFSVVNMLAHVKAVSFGVAMKIEEAAIKFTKLADSRRKKRIELQTIGQKKGLLNKKIMDIELPVRNQ